MRNLGFIILFLLIVGCTKEKIEDNTNQLQHRWTAHPNFVYDRVSVLNSYADSNNLYFLGRYFTVFSDSGKQIKNYVLNGEFNINYKLPIGQLFYLQPGDPSTGYVSVQGIKPIASNNCRGISIKRIDNSFVYSHFINYWSSECMKINSENQILIPYNTSDNSVSFQLIDMKINTDDKYWIDDTLKTKKITISSGSPQTNLTFVYSLFSNKDYYFATLENAYKIKSDGSFSKILDGRVSKFFHKNDTLYSLVSGFIYQSTNDGDSWINIGAIPQNFDMLNYLDYYLVNNEIIGTYNAQLFHLIINKNTLTVKEIDNDGLVNNSITSVSKYHDKVYVTTLSGVYYINYKDFFNYKP